MMRTIGKLGVMTPHFFCLSSKNPTKTKTLKLSFDIVLKTMVYCICNEKKMTEKYVQIDGGKHQQQLLVQDIVNWFSSKYFKRFKFILLEIDLLDIDGSEVNGWCYEQEPKYCCVEIDKKKR